MEFSSKRVVNARGGSGLGQCVEKFSMAFPAKITIIAAVPPPVFAGPAAGVAWNSSFADLWEIAKTRIPHACKLRQKSPRLRLVFLT